MLTLNASIRFVPEYYSPNLRATVPPVWCIDFHAPLPVPGHNLPPQYVGETREDAIRNTVAGLQSLGLHGRLHLSA